MIIEIIIQIIILIFFLFFFIITYSFPELDIGGTFGSATWPRTILFFGMILCLISMYNILIKKNYVPSDITKTKLSKFAVASTIMIMYIYLVKILGFIITTPFLLAAYMYQMNMRKPINIIFFSLIISFIFVYLFGSLLQVNLPRGTGLLRILSFYFY